MQNLAIFLESNKDAAYYRQQVSERGILEKIDDLNEGLLNIKGVTEENLPLVYEMLNEVEISLNKNANDPRTRMVLQKFTIDEEKTAAAENEDTEGLTEETQELTGEPTGESDPTKKEDTQELTGEPDPAEKTEETTNETQEPTGEPTGEPDPAEKVDTDETTNETQEPASESEPTEKANTEETTTETPEPKKSGRRKKIEPAE